jgi:hypothetical protein
VGNPALAAVQGDHHQCRLPQCAGGALEGLLKQILIEPGQYGYQVEDKAEELAQEWFTEEGKKKILELLRGFQLDESAIEAEAIRSRSSELESLDRMIASLESRRDEALRFLAGYRASVARQLRESLDQITADVLKIEAASKKSSTAA